MAFFYFYEYPSVQICTLNRSNYLLGQDISDLRFQTNIQQHCKEFERFGPVKIWIGRKLANSGFCQLIGDLVVLVTGLLEVVEGVGLAVGLDL